MWPVLISAALAHPFEARLYGHQTAVRLHATTIEVDYALEIPTLQLIAELKRALAGNPRPGEAEQAQFNDDMHRELSGALRLVVDDQPVPWQVVAPEESSGQGDAKFIVYRLTMSAPLPPGSQTVHLIDGNYPDVPSIFHTVVQVDGDLMVDASSLMDVEDGALRASRDGQWRMEESSRELRMSFREKPGGILAGLRWLAGDRASGLQPAAEALTSVHVPADAQLIAGRLHTGLAVVMLLSAAGLSALQSRTSSHPVASALVAGAGIAAVGLAASSPSAPLLAGAMMALAALVGLLGRRVVFTAPLLILAAHKLPLLAAVGLVVGAFLGRGGTGQVRWKRLSGALVVVSLCVVSVWNPALIGLNFLTEVHVFSNE